jgi:hypothetical protein
LLPMIPMSEIRMLLPGAEIDHKKPEVVD